MTNQMKNLLRLSFVFSSLSLALMLALLISSPFGYANIFSYCLLGVNLVLFVLLGINLSVIEYKEYKYRKKILKAKTLLVLRDKAVLDFYKKHKIKPQYNEKGKLLTPDELLKIVIKQTESGIPEKTIYEILGIEPVLDENGKEVPVVLVLKHLIKKLKTENLEDIKGLKGLYLKGSKKEKAKSQEKPKAKKNDKEKSGGKSKGGKKKGFPLDLVIKKSGSGGGKDKKGGKSKDTPKQNKEEPKPEKKVEPIKKEEIKEKVKNVEASTESNFKKSYYERMFAASNVNNKNNSGLEKDDSGEFTLE